MNRLLCAVGMHRAAWQPVQLTPVADPQAAHASGWVQIRKCIHCGQLIGKRLR